MIMSGTPPSPLPAVPLLRKPGLFGWRAGVAAPTAVLIRPDGYVAWVGDRTQRGLTDALTTWFGTACCDLARRSARG